MSLGVATRLARGIFTKKETFDKDRCKTGCIKPEGDHDDCREVQGAVARL